MVGRFHFWLDETPIEQNGLACASMQEENDDCLISSGRNVTLHCLDIYLCLPSLPEPAFKAETASAVSALCQRAREGDLAGTAEFIVLPSEELKAFAVSHFAARERGVFADTPEQEALSGSGRAEA